MAQIQGRYALTYEGVNAPTPPNFIFETRAPTSSDYIGIDIGTIWLNQIKTAGNPPVYSTSLPYMLVAKAQSFGTWVPLGGGGGGATPVTNTVYFNTPGTFVYTPTVGISQVSVELVGGGGAGYAYGIHGQTSPYTGSQQADIAMFGGAAGGYCKKLYTAAEIGAAQNVVVGAAGIASNFVPGGGARTWTTATTGGNSTFMGMTAFGAAPPPLFIPGTYPLTFTPTNGAFGGAATGGDLNIPGTNSLSTVTYTFDGTYNVLQAAACPGANSMYGTGGASTASGGSLTSVFPGLGYGSGGSSTVLTYGPGNASDLGSNGAPGICIITEYF